MRFMSVKCILSVNQDSLFARLKFQYACAWGDILVLSTVSSSIFLFYATKE